MTPQLKVKQRRLNIQRTFFSNVAVRTFQMCLCDHDHMYWYIIHIKAADLSYLLCKRTHTRIQIVHTQTTANTTLQILPKQRLLQSVSHFVWRNPNKKTFRFWNTQRRAKGFRPSSDAEFTANFYPMGKWFVFVVASFTWMCLRHQRELWRERDLIREWLNTTAQRRSSTKTETNLMGLLVWWDVTRSTFNVSELKDSYSCDWLGVTLLFVAILSRDRWLCVFKPLLWAFKRRAVFCFTLWWLFELLSSERSKIAHRQGKSPSCLIIRHLNPPIFLMYLKLFWTHFLDFRARYTASHDSFKLNAPVETINKTGHCTEEISFEIGHFLQWSIAH